MEFDKNKIRRFVFLINTLFGWVEYLITLSFFYLSLVLYSVGYCFEKKLNIAYRLFEI